MMVVPGIYVISFFVGLVLLVVNLTLALLAVIVAKSWREDTIRVGAFTSFKAGRFSWVIGNFLLSLLGFGLSFPTGSGAGYSTLFGPGILVYQLVAIIIPRFRNPG